MKTSEKNNQQIEIFFENIRFLKAKHNLSKRELAKICGTSISSIDKLLNGILPNISCCILFRISKHFSLQASELFSPLE